ncbi:MAG: TonB-dependent receptor [Pseudomonadales bacterium]|nr:TonB-dependent receptor [Pseudomonadales bacterium]MCP5214048.1 TonB-dependent receptor [Pseudomonadales bacterium]MCP5302746.1 TonB-dependent receptor [Pseudomonadales bacterium]
MAIINKIVSGKYFAVLAITIFVTTGTINAAELEEIIVTAQKRAESLQDVPISVTTLAGVKMQQAGINKIEDLQQFVPNLQMTETGISTQVYIRGIGTGNSQGFEQSVGQYIDGIYYGRQQLIRAPFLDLERVEVLRGPQSILFGKNSIAGALNMTSAKPTEELSGYIQLNYESEYSTREALVAVSGALTDTVKGRLAIRSYDTDGYVENTFLNSDEPERDDLAIRGILQWDVTDDLDMTLKLERDTFDTTGRQIEIIRDDPALAGSPIPGANYNVILGLLGHPGAITESKLDFERQAGGFGVKESSDNELENLTLTINYNLGKNTLTSVTGFVSYEFLELCDCDYVAAPVFSVVLDEEYDQFSQEFRLTSPGGENIDWVAGVFFQTSELDFADRIVIPSNSVLGLVSGGALAPIRSTQVARDFSSDSDLWAVFGQLTWNIQDNLRLTLGARFTSEEKDGSRKVSVIDTATGTPSNPLLGAPTIYEAVF